MKKLCWSSKLAVVLVTAVSLLVSVTEAGAADLKWRQPQHGIKAELVQVGDVPGHVVGAGENGGLAFFESGEVAINSTKFTIDYTNGSGTHQFYSLYTFEDGSTFVTKGQGTATSDQTRKTAMFKGTFSFIQGTGRFARIEGEGSYTGKRFAPLPGAGAEIYVDNAATYTVPYR